MLCYVLISTESVTNVNKAAVAIFMGALGWVLYICYGTDFVTSQHGGDYVNFLNGASATSEQVKYYIAQNVFLKYVGRGSEIALFLLATMEIVEILSNNGCFDFLSQLMKTRSAQRLLWTVAAITLVISANLDNLTTTVMMLMIVNKILPNRRQKVVFGSVILISANCGGALTVIGDPTGLWLWNGNQVTASAYSVKLIPPVLAMWAMLTAWLGRLLPERVDTEWITMPYRGDDTRLNVWQRIGMLVLGIGGLWFIPTFHDITKLSPFVGALCVLAVLWIVNEIFNRKLMTTEQAINRQGPRELQYGSLQMAFFVLGIMLMVGVVEETGAVRWFANVLNTRVSDQWIIAVVAGVVSSVVDNFAAALAFFSLGEDEAQNANYWLMVTYATMVGGNVLAIGSISGLALMRHNRITSGWYFSKVGWKALVCGIVGFGILLIELI